LRDQAFNNKSVYQRIAIVAAGPLVNLIFAVFAYACLFLSGVNVVVPVIGQIVPGSPAAQASLPVEQEVLAVDGHQVQSWNEVNLRLASRVGESGDIEITVGEPARGLARTYTLPINQWDVDLERESPLMAVGIEPWRPDVPPVIGQVLPEGAAAAAGLQPGDRILSVNGRPVDEWMALVAMIQAAPEQTLEIWIERAGREQRLQLTPARRELPDGAVQGYVGAGPEPFELPAEMQRSLSYGPVGALMAGVEKTGQMIGLTLESIGKMIAGVISVKNLSGPITIAKVAGTSAASGLESFVSFLAYLSVSLGVLNLLPIPMLDGGHLLYYAVELVRGRPVSEQVQMLGLRIGMALLFSLMALAIVNDLARLF